MHSREDSETAGRVGTSQNRDDKYDDDFQMEGRPTFINYLRLWFFNPFVVGISAGIGHFIAYWLSQQLLKIPKIKSLIY